MNQTSPPSLVLDADPFLVRSGLPYWALGRFREMRLGDEFALVAFEAPGIVGSSGYAGVTITRHRGFFRLSAVWTAHLGKNALRRGHLISRADFKLMPHRKLELVQVERTPGEDVRYEAFRQVERVLRRAVALSRWAKQSGDRRAASAITPDHFMCRYGAEPAAGAWLEGLRGPELRITAGR